MNDDDDFTISREARILMDADGTTPQECPDTHHALHGGALFPGVYECNSISVPRVWHLPDRPSHGTKVRDRFGVVWARRPDDPDWLDLWYSDGMNAMHWYDLLGRRGPVTEVL